MNSLCQFWKDSNQNRDVPVARQQEAGERHAGLAVGQLLLPPPGRRVRRQAGCG
ncbi:hypothetical protein ACX80J_05485 [Arthrobacter sp. MDB2-24]